MEWKRGGKYVEKQERNTAIRHSVGFADNTAGKRQKLPAWTRWVKLGQNQSSPVKPFFNLDHEYGSRDCEIS
jgi:hypothetical protein